MEYGQLDTMSPQFGMMEQEVRFDFCRSLGPPHLFDGGALCGLISRTAAGNRA